MQKTNRKNLSLSLVRYLVLSVHVTGESRPASNHLGTYFLNMDLVTLVLRRSLSWNGQTFEQAHSREERLVNICQVFQGSHT